MNRLITHEIKKALEYGNVIRFIIEVSNILGRTASFKIFIAQFITSGIVFKADRLVYFFSVSICKLNFITVGICNTFFYTSLPQIAAKHEVFNRLLCGYYFNSSFS